MAGIKEKLDKRREGQVKTETAKNHMQYLINLEKERKERAKRVEDAKTREDALKEDFRQNMAPRIIGSLFGDDNPQQAKDVKTPITSVAPTYSTPTPQVKAVETPTVSAPTPAPQAVQEEKVETPTPQVAQAPTAPAPQAIETPKEASVLTPEQKEDIISSEARNFPFVKPAEAVKAEADRMNYEQMIQQMNRKAEEKQADIDKRNRRRAIFGVIGDGVEALSNLFFTTKGAPSVKYDPNTSLSARAVQLDAQRKAEDEKAYLQAKNDQKDAITEERLRRQDERQDRIDRENKEYRDKALAQQEQYRQDQLALQKYNAELNAQVRREQFEAQAEREAAKQNAITYRTLYKRGSGSSGVTPLYIGNGEVIDIPSKALSEQKNVSAVYYALPEAYRKAAFEKFNLGKYNEKKQLTPTQMNQIIGEYIEMDGAEAAREILRNLSGGQPSTGSKQTGLGWGISNESDSNEVDW